MLWITTPFGDSRACVNYVEPKEYILAVEQLPEGSGSLRVIDGQLVRVANISGPIIPEQDETPEQSGNEYNAFLEGLMEGYQNG